MTYIVRKNTQLTSLQPYVWCAAQETAEAVANCFNNGTRKLESYDWKTNAPKQTKEHWCVVEDKQFVVAYGHEVLEDEWYAGPWSTLTKAMAICIDVNLVPNEIDGYISSFGLVSFADRNCCVIVLAEQHANPAAPLYRWQLDYGDTFEYIDAEIKGKSHPHFICGRIPDDMPKGWVQSTTKSAQEGKCWENKVRRIPHWRDAKKTEKPAKIEPVILPCVDPLERFTQLGSVEGLTALECLARYEEAMQAEDHRVIRHNDELMVGLPPGTCGVVGGSQGGLSPAQLRHAQNAWSMKLVMLQEQTVERENANQLVCDDVDEMPNMVTVP